MRFVASKALSAAAFFLATVAILINAPSLFYMATALIATIASCHIQSYLAVRALRFERVAPGVATVGETLAIEIVVWSERRIRRPLVTVVDRLPMRMAAFDISPSLPIAPAYDLPVRTRYTFRPGRRGVFRWRGVVVEGTDALGLVSKRRAFQTEESELRVLPRPIPVNIELPLAAGYGLSENESGQNRGAGLDFYGLREYVPGDPLRRVHWRTSQRAGRLMVKEFEAGSHAAAAFILPLEQGSDLGKTAPSSLDLMVGHLAFLSGELLRQGARVGLPQFEEGLASNHADRYEELLEHLTVAEANRPDPMAEALLTAASMVPAGSAVYVMTAIADASLVDAIAQAGGAGVRVAVLAYDGGLWDRNIRPATDPDFQDDLAAAGAHVIPMPGFEESE